MYYLLSFMLSLSFHFVFLFFFFFFFKQKTAYEIYQCDWSSDVCSSDLDDLCVLLLYHYVLLKHKQPSANPATPTKHSACPHLQTVRYSCQQVYKIGRASCRERVQISVVAVSLKKKKKKSVRHTGAASKKYNQLSKKTGQ